VDPTNASCTEVWILRPESVVWPDQQQDIDGPGRSQRANELNAPGGEPGGVAGGERHIRDEEHVRGRLRCPILLGPAFSIPTRGH